MPPDSSSEDVAVRKTIPPTPRNIQAFIQGHLDRLQKERQAELEESRLLLSAVSPKVLEANGLALTRLGVLSTSIGIGGKRMVELHRPTAYHSDANLPPNAFRSGDVVAIVDEAAAGAGESTSGKASKGKASTSKGNKEAEPIDGVVVKVLDTKIVVAISHRRKGGSTDAAEEDPLPTRCRLVKVANEVTWERMENNLRRLAMKLDVPVRTSRGIRGGGLGNKQPQGSAPGDKDDEDDEDDDEDDEDVKTPSKPSQASRPSSATPLPAPPEAIPHVPDLLRYLLGLSSPSSLPAQLDAPPLPLYNPSLNEPQRLALSRALTTRSLHLVHGPPGTGKTTLLVELVLQLVLGRGERVLVAGSSNLAVDNLGARLVAFATGAAGSGGGKASSKGISDLKCCRIGHPARILAGLQSHTLDHLATTSSSGELLSDVRSELQSTYSSLHPPASSSSASSSAGNKSTSRRGTSSLNSKRLTGNERRKAWEEVRELRKELRQRERGLFTQTIEDANVVLSTLHGAAGGVLERAMRKKPAAAAGAAGGEGDGAAAAAAAVANPAKKQRRFDTIVIDEACQAIEASTWGAVLDTFDEESGGARLILAGDDRQLGPVVKSESSLGGRKKKEGGEKKGRKSKKAEKGKKDVDEDQSKPEELAEKAGEALKIEDSAPDAGDDADGTGDDKESEQEDDDSQDDEEEDATALSTKPVETSAATNSKSSRPPRPSKLHPPRSLSQTLFTRLLRTYGSGPTIKSLLTVQYRMNDLIMEFPNKEMYEGQLVAHESCKDRWVGDGGVAGGWTPKADGEEEVVEGEGLVCGRVVFYDTAGAEMYESTGESSSPLRSTSKSNPHEVHIIASHLSLLVHTHGFPTSSITLLAPYSAQVSALAAAFPSTEWPGMEIGTIDALQGREQDVVIISLVRSSEETRGASDGDDDDRVGFLAEERRLNVAMTRARRQLVVVGDSETIRAGGRGGYLERWMEWLEERAVVEPVLPVT